MGIPLIDLVGIDADFVDPEHPFPIRMSKPGQGLEDKGGNLAWVGAYLEREVV